MYLKLVNFSKSSKKGHITIMPYKHIPNDQNERVEKERKRSENDRDMKEEMYRVMRER